MKKKTELNVLRTNVGEVPTFCMKYNDVLVKLGQKIVQLWQHAF